MKKLSLYALTYVFCLGLDLIWLRLIAKNIYINSLFDLLKKHNGEVASNIPAALLVYVVMTFGIFYFVMPNAKDYAQAIYNGAIFGLILYGVYNLTNYAILADWPLKITVIDFCWGVVLCTFTSVFAFIMQKIMIKI